MLKGKGGGGGKEKKGRAFECLRISACISFVRKEGKRKEGNKRAIWFEGGTKEGGKGGKKRRFLPKPFSLASKAQLRGGKRGDEGLITKRVETFKIKKEGGGGKRGDS